MGDSLFTMFAAYFDDAYNGDFTLACGWIASLDEWIGFHADWVCLLGNYKIPYFHMKEFSQSRGPFEKWENTKCFRARFLHDVHDIISSRVRRGFICGIQKTLFDRVNRSYRLEESFPSCYALVGREAMDWAERVAKDKDVGGKVKCIFEDGGADKGGLIRAAKVAPMTSNIPGFEPSRDIKNRKKGIRKGIVQIQAADFLAYEVRRFIADHPQIRAGQKKARESFRMFGQKKPDTKLMSEDRILATCHRYGIKTRNSGTLT